MKKSIIYFVCSFFAIFIGCQESAEDDSFLAGGTGALNLKTAISTNITIPVITRSIQIEADKNEFYVAIYNREDGELVKSFDTYSALIDSGLPLVLPIGEYRALASSYEIKDTEVSSKPYFLGEDEFSIIEKKISNVELKCKFKSIGVELRLSQQFQDKIAASPANYEYEVTISNGKTSYRFTPDNMDPGYFTSNCDQLQVKVRVRLGDDIWYPERISYYKNVNGESPRLGEYYIFTLDAGEMPEVKAMCIKE